MFAIAKLQQPLILLRISRKCTTPSARRLLKVTLVLMDFEHLLKGSKSKEGSEVLSTGMEKKKKKREQFFTGFLVLFVKHWCLTVAETWPRELPFCAHSLCQRHHFLLLIGWEQNNMALPWGVQNWIWIWIEQPDEALKMEIFAQFYVLWPADIFSFVPFNVHAPFWFETCKTRWQVSWAADLWLHPLSVFALTSNFWYFTS